MLHVGLRCANPTYESVDPYPAMGSNLYQFVVSVPIFALSDHQCRQGRVAPERPAARVPPCRRLYRYVRFQCDGLRPPLAGPDGCVVQVLGRRLRQANREIYRLNQF